MSYVAASDVVAYGEFDDAASDVPLLGTLIPLVQAAIDGYTGRTFESDSDDVASHYFTVDEDTLDLTLYLDDDLAAISSVYSGSVNMAGQYVTVPRNKTPYYALKLKDVASHDWSDGTDSDGSYDGAIIVTGNWAYSTTAPNDIKLVALKLTYLAYKQRVGLEQTTQPVMTPSGAMILPARWPADVLQMLEPYRKRFVV